MQQYLITEFKPTLFFLGKFIALYLVCNLVYGLYVSSFRPQPDPVTNLVTRQTSWLLNNMGWDNVTNDDVSRPATFIQSQGRNVLSVYEGCNGINVMIIFVAFIVSFGPLKKTALWFIPIGVVLIHVANLSRIFLLFFVSMEFPKLLYFTHKYLFTGVIFFIVFVLWVLWVKFFALRKYGKS